MPVTGRLAQDPAAHCWKSIHPNAEMCGLSPQKLTGRVVTKKWKSDFDIQADRIVTDLLDREIDGVERALKPLVRILRVSGGVPCRRGRVYSDGLRE